MKKTGLQRPRVLDMTDHLMQEAAFSDRRDPQQEGARAVDRAADDGVSRGLLDRDGLAGHQ